MNFIDLAGIVGGVQNLIFVMIAFFVTPFADLSYKLQAIESLFIVRKFNQKKIFDEFVNDEFI